MSSNEKKTSFVFYGEAVEQLVGILEKSEGVSEIDYRNGELRIRVRREASMTLAPPHVSSLSHLSSSSPESVKEMPAEKGQSVTSPMVGTVYLAPKVGAEPFVKVGDTVQEGQVLLIIEAMKVMNPIKSPASGVITLIRAKNGLPVEYGEELLRLQ